MAGMTKYVEWSELWSLKDDERLICRMSFEDIARVMRRAEPRYTSDEQAVADFITAHWGKVVEYPK